MNVLIPNMSQQLLSFSKSLSTCEWHNKKKNMLSLTFSEPSRMRTVIRMGGGPRTFPGGVSKWQWKRMQAKKAKQLLKARLCRERQIYEMRKRAELKAAVSELERPWEVVEKAPKLFSVSADEQVKVLADRFQKPGGFDLWSEKDGPQLFETPEELPSARFFPKGVVHSIKPYRKVSGDELVEGSDVEEDDGGGDGGWSSDLSEDFVDGSDDGGGGSCSPYGRNGVKFDGRMRKNGNGRRFLLENVDGSDDGEGGSSSSSSPLNYGRNGVKFDDRMRKNGNGRRFLLEDADGSDDGEGGSSSSPLNYGRNGMKYDSRLRNHGNGRRFLSEDVGKLVDGEHSSPLNYGRNGVKFDGRLRNNGNGRRFMSDDDAEGSSSLNYGRNRLNVDGRMRKNGNGRKFYSKGADGLDDEESSSPSLGSRRNGVSFDSRLRNEGSGRRVLSKDGYKSHGSDDSRLRRKGSGRRFVTKDVDESNGMYAGRVSYGRRQRGSNSIAGRSDGKYTRRTSEYASRRFRDADSEVYDMGLQQDGSYGFKQKSEQSDSTNW